MKKLILAISLFIFLNSCGDDKPQKNVQTNEVKTDTLSLANKLAVLDNKGPVADTSINVIRIGVLLNKLSHEYNEPKDTIADLTSRLQGVLHDQGIAKSNLSILEEMYTTGVSKGVKYKDAIILYGMLITK